MSEVTRDFSSDFLRPFREIITKEAKILDFRSLLSVSHENSQFLRICKLQTLKLQPHFFHVFTLK
jgi:hypothetical protein